MKYKFIRKCLVMFFRFLVKIGFRQCILNATVYYPPSMPTYILRPVIQSDSNSSFKQLIVTQFPEPKLSQFYESEESFRFHRISSVITEKTFQRQKTSSKNSNEEEQKISELKTEKQCNEIQSKKSRIQYKARMKYKLQQIQTYEVNLISQKLNCPVSIQVPDNISVNGLYLRTEGKKYFACFNIETPESDYILIYSHGNSPDMGIMLDTYLDICFNLGINVFAYDYFGYGQSYHEMSDFGMIQQIHRVYHFVRYTLNYDWNKILLYGHSLGVGVSTILAANQDCPIGGLVIHSGFMSGLKVVNPNEQFYSWDLFPNLELLEYVNCSVFIIHGQEDLLISSYHATAMARKCGNLYRIWLANGGGHNDIAYNENLRDFFQYIKEKNSSLTIEEILKINRAGQWKQTIDHVYNQDLSRGTSSQQTDQFLGRQNTLNETILSKRINSQIELNQSPELSNNSPGLNVLYNSRTNSQKDNLPKQRNSISQNLLNST